MARRKLPKGLQLASNGLYKIDIREGEHRIARSAKTRNLKDAVKALEAAREELLSLCLNDHTGETLKATVRQDRRLSDAVEDMYQLQWSQNRTGMEVYKKAERIVALLDDPLVADITLSHIRELKKVLLRKGIATGTINRYMATLKTLCIAEYHLRNLAVVPKFDMYTEKKRHRVLSPVEEQEMLKFFKNDIDMLDYFTVLIDTGMRAGELRQVTKRHVRLDLRKFKLANEVNMKLKTFTPREIPMTQRVFEIMTRRVDEARDYLFDFGPTKVKKHWNKFRDHMKLKNDPDFVPHALRHTFATRLLEKNVSIYMVRDLLGHSSVKTTERYTSTAYGDLHEAITALESS